MQRLTSTDAALLHGETAEWHLHVTSLLPLDGGTVPGGYRFPELREALAARLGSVPRFRQRVVTTPLALDRPVWVDAGGFDPGRHIRRVTLAAPADERALFDLAGRFAAEKLDRGRPLWEVRVVEDPDGSLRALLIKNHHVLFDGVGGLEAMQALFDTSADGPATPPPAPDAPDPDAPDPEPGAADPEPGAAELLARAALNSVSTQPVQTARLAARIVRKVVIGAAALRAHGRPVTGLDAPANPFGGRITTERTMAAVSLPLPAIKRIRSLVPAATVNDVLLAAIGGALRSYLAARGTVPDASLVANVAVSTRPPDAGPEAGNRFGVIYARLGTRIADPVERLRAIVGDTTRAKRIAREMADSGELTLSAAGAPVVVAALARLYSGLGLQDRLPVIGNVGVSNVPGPPVELFVAGAELRGIYVMGPLMLNSVINFTAVSRAGRLDVGIVSSPSVLPEPGELVRHLTGAVEELDRAAGGAELDRAAGG